MVLKRPYIGNTGEGSAHSLFRSPSTELLKLVWWSWKINFRQFNLGRVLRSQKNVFWCLTFGGCPGLERTNFHHKHPMMPTLAPVVSCDKKPKSHFFTQFWSFWPNKWNCSIDDAIGATWCQCQCQCCHMTKKSYCISLQSYWPKECNDAMTMPLVAHHATTGAKAVTWGKLMLHLGLIVSTYWCSGVIENPVGIRGYWHQY